MFAKIRKRLHIRNYENNREKLKSLLRMRKCAKSVLKVKKVFERANEKSPKSNS